MKFTFTLFFSALILHLFAQQNISEVRNQPQGTRVTVSGIVTNGSELGTIRYMQDSTGGLGVYDGQLSSVKRGDSITVSGEVNPYNNLFEITKVSSLTIHSSGNKLPEAKVISIGEIGESYEGQLLQINDVTIENTSGTFAGNTNYNFSDGDKSGEFRVNTNSPIVGQLIPTKPVSLVAICSQFSYSANDTQNGYQLLPRDMDDFISSHSVNITSIPTVSDISTSGFKISWTSDVDAMPKVTFGSSSEPGSLSMVTEGTSTQVNEGFLQEVILSGLEPATIIYAKCMSIAGTDTAFSNVNAYATQSLSTGKIHVYFNTQVAPDENISAMNINTSFSRTSGLKSQMADPLLYIGTDMEDTLIAYINRAEQSIDFCIYNINNFGLTNVSQALNAAWDRGIQVRLITSGNTSHSGVNELRDEIPVLVRPDISNGGIMHNKFAVIDANTDDPDKVWVWTGSTNISLDQVNSDANNMVFIQDQSLAKTYKIEFEEMWGTNSLQPNLAEAKFGEDKTDNTPHEFIIGGKRIESYFSPSDNTNQKIINAINTANNDLEVETMLITRTDLAYSISDAAQRGVNVHVITNYSPDNTDAVNGILSEALPQGKYIFDDLANGILHNKLAVIDAKLTSSDPQVITGSHNWSYSADTQNDENTLIIHDAGIANSYLRQFVYRFEENGGNLYLSADKIEIPNVTIYPNPAVNQVTISTSQKVSSIELYSTSGKLVLEQNGLNTNHWDLDMQHKIPGIYFLKVKFQNNRQNTYKIIKR